jgi:CDP-glycerol glycerophosphotransferase
VGTGNSRGLSRLRTAVSTRLSRLRRAASPEGEGGEEAPNPPLGEDPLVSIIVPVYQVEAYLEECLDSVLAQRYQNLEVILVDDGSFDRSVEIAQSYVDRDSRFVMVRQENAGLGAARNTGLQRCTGELVTFLDSDDMLPPRAVQAMVRSLSSSGSDLVVGSFVRVEGRAETIRPWIKQVHGQPRIGITVEDFPEVLSSVFAWGKMFRREFIDRIGLCFPVGVRYEDQVPITRAYLRAGAFDIIPDQVYRWRRREDGTSITQQKGGTADLHDRLATKREVAELMIREASHEVTRTWYVKVFRLDLFAYFRVSAKQDDDYWRELSMNTRALREGAPDDIDDHIEVRFRLAAWLAAHDRREALYALLSLEELNSSNFPVKSHDGALFADLGLPEVTAANVPEDLLRLRPCDLLMRPHLASLDWSRPGRLGIRALAVVRHVDPRLHEVSTRLALGRARGGEDRLTVPCSVDPDPDGNIEAGRHHEDHTDSTVRGDLDLSALVAASGDEPLARWVVEVEASTMGIDKVAPLDTRHGYGSAALSHGTLVDGSLVTVSWSEWRGLVLEVRSLFAAVEDARCSAGLFEVDVRVPPGVEVLEVRAGQDRVPATVTPVDPVSGRVTLALPAAELADRGVSGRMRVDCGWENPVPLSLTTEIEVVVDPHSGLSLDTAPDGTLRLSENAAALFVDDVELTADTVRLEGRTRGLREFVAHLRGPRAETPGVPVTLQGDRFAVEIPATRTTWGGRVTALPSNGYTLVARTEAGEVKARAGALVRDPQPRPAAHGWTVEVGERRGVVLRRARLDDPLLQSGFRQRELRDTVYQRARSGPRADTVVFECFGGSAAGDSPRAVCDLLQAQGTDLDLVWSVSDASVLVPEGTRTVVRLSPEWYDVVGSAKYLLNNSNFHSRFRKADGQVYVQTWHGTPLKRIGLDIDDPRHFNDSYLRLMEREAAAWDHLVSPSPFCTEIFPRAFGYDGPVLEIGYPRNDLLVAPGVEDRRNAVRKELGIRDGQRVVLYAPTWRENAKAGAGYDKVLHLDAGAVVDARPEVTVLVRGHANTAGRAVVDDGDRVVDVTSYPDVGRLCLAADVLVTDYSSVFFDFALTGKPILFLVPDLEKYRDELRGFYLDFEEIAPGPLLRTTDEVLAHLDDDPAGFADARERIRARFAPHDDGHAAERLVQQVFGQG